jgi:hypothetical protein
MSGLENVNKVLSDIFFQLSKETKLSFSEIQASFCLCLEKTLPLEERSRCITFTRHHKAENIDDEIKSREDDSDTDTSSEVVGNCSDCMLVNSITDPTLIQIFTEISRET